MFGLALNDRFDINLPGPGGFTRRAGVAYLAQKIRSILSTIEGESLVDPTLGLNYFGTPFSDPISIAGITAAFREAILDVPEVDRILELSLDYDGETRRLQVSFRATSTLGDVQINRFNLQRVRDPIAQAIGQRLTDDANRQLIDDAFNRLTT